MSNMEIDETADTVIKYDDDYSLMWYHLPEEVLCHIFSFLRLDDRKSVRLVSRFWYRLSTIWSITKNEKFVFRSNSHIEDFVKVMLKSNFAFANLEFQGLRILSLPVKFWSVFGPRIYSLELFQCGGNDEMIKNIIIHCKNLISFSYLNWEFNLGNEFLRSSEVLDELVEKGIQQTKLCTFDVFTIDNYSMDALDKIFLIYPGIRCFSLRSNNPPDLCLPISLRSLTLRLCPIKPELFFETYLTKAEQCLRLECFNFRLPIDCTSTKSHFVKGLFKFFSSQKDLNVIHLNIQYSCHSSIMGCNCQIVKELFFHIFNSCPNLKELSFVIERKELRINLEELPQLLSSISKLQSLQITFDIFDRQNIDWPNASKSLMLPQNLLLTTLDLSAGEMIYQDKDHIYAMLLPRCPLLRHLKLYLGSNDILQTIFKHLLKLQILITYIQDCSHHGFSGDNDSTGEVGYSIKRLQQLKQIRIRGLRSIESIEKILLEFQLPHLELLDLDVGLETVPLEVWGQILSQVPELRELSLFIFEDYSTVVCMETFIEFGKHLKRLRHLCIRNDPDDVFYFQCSEPEIFRHIINRIEEIFNACPSLRYFTQGEFDMFCFDSFTKKVLKVKDKDTLLFRPDISGEFVELEPFGQFSFLIF